MRGVRKPGHDHDDVGRPRPVPDPRPDPRRVLRPPRPAGPGRVDAGPDGPGQSRPSGRDTTSIDCEPPTTSTGDPVARPAPSPATRATSAAALLEAASRRARSRRRRRRPRAGPGRRAGRSSRTVFAPPTIRTGTSPARLAELELDPLGAAGQRRSAGGRSSAGRPRPFWMPPTTSIVHGIVVFSPNVAVALPPVEREAAVLDEDAAVAEADLGRRAFERGPVEVAPGRRRGAAGARDRPDRISEPRSVSPPSGAECSDGPRLRRRRDPGASRSAGGLVAGDRLHPRQEVVDERELRVACSGRSPRRSRLADPVERRPGRWRPSRGRPRR